MISANFGFIIDLTIIIVINVTIIVICQASKLRQMLQEWERSSEDYQEQLNSAVADREQLQSRLDQMSAENTRWFSVISHKFLNESSLIWDF